MDKKIKIFFDKQGDVLDIAIGEPGDAISKELGNDIIMRLDTKTKEIVGFTILNFEKRFEHLNASDLQSGGGMAGASSFAYILFSSLDVTTSMKIPYINPNPISASIPSALKIAIPILTTTPITAPHSAG